MRCSPFSSIQFGLFVAVVTLLAGAHSAIAAPPTVTVVSPNRDYVTGDTLAIIRGTNFTGTTAVKFGTTDAGFTVDSDTKITAVVPPHAAGTVAVRVTNADGASLHTTNDSFRYEALPTVTAISKFRGGADLATPTGWLIADKLGNLYGVAQSGGAANRGGVFMLSPPASPGGTWTRTILYIFDGANSGGNPFAGLVADSEGRLYGTTTSGHALEKGGVFRLTPRPPGSMLRKWRFENLYTFQGTADDGFMPTGGVVLDEDGNLYGATADGVSFFDGLGVIYKLTATPSGPWQFKKLHAFTTATGPRGRLHLDADGVIWGMTNSGGAHNAGTVFKFTPPRGDVTRVPRRLYSFKNSAADGQFPFYGGLVFDDAGNMYGTTSSGGFYGIGGVVKLAPQPPPSTGFTESPIFLFDFGNFGMYPNYGVRFDRHGALVGVSEAGGPSTAGVIFKLAPPVGGESNWAARLIYSFPSDHPVHESGKMPNSEVLVRGRTMFGTTGQGGNAACNCGVVYMITE